jgi:hypothetical protein
LRALLYHRRCPCANPGSRLKMDKMEAIGIRQSWRTD